jgi:GTP-binding protein
MTDILNASFLTSAPNVASAPLNPPNTPEIVLVGRSNVGKSSFINSLIKRKQLAKTSNTPGKTRLMNFYDVAIRQQGQPQSLWFVDFPGYGYAAVSKTEQASWGEHLTDFLSTRQSIRLVLQIVDIRHELKAQDAQMLSWLIHHNLPYLVILNKTDKLNTAELRKQQQLWLKAASAETALAEEHVIAYSSETHSGRDAVWRLLLQHVLEEKSG